jgi:hypothetical protein
LYSLFFNPYICFSFYKAILRGLVNYICFKVDVKANVDHEPPEDGLLRAETYVGVKE